MAKTPTIEPAKTAEAMRLEEGAGEGGFLQAMGALPQRAPVGHSPRGLQQ